MTRPLTFAAVGDVHGHMHAMVDLVTAWEGRNGASVDFVLQVGDFEPHRHEADMATMSCPAKYRKLGDFPAFYGGERAFPWLVLFIGGNHEPYGFLDRFPDGVDAATRCRYLGRAGSIEHEGLRIAYLSAIHREAAYDRPRPPVDQILTRSNKDYIYFTEEEVGVVASAEDVDVLLLHDWPRGVIAPGDAPEFEGFRRCEDGINGVGNAPARLLVDMLEPRLVLCGHMHKRYRNVIHYPSGREGQLCCMDKVRHTNPNALAVFRTEGDGALVEIT
jgi:hypothetical protein